MELGLKKELSLTSVWSSWRSSNTSVAAFHALLRRYHPNKHWTPVTANLTRSVECSSDNTPVPTRGDGLAMNSEGSLSLILLPISKSVTSVSFFAVVIVVIIVVGGISSPDENLLPFVWGRRSLWNHFVVCLKDEVGSEIPSTSIRSRQMRTSFIFDAIDEALLWRGYCSFLFVVFQVLLSVVVETTVMQLNNHFHSPFDNSEQSTKSNSWPRVTTQIRVCEQITPLHCTKLADMPVLFVEVFPRSDEFQFCRTQSCPKNVY